MRATSHIMRSIPTQSPNASPRANTAAHRKQFIQFVLPLNLLLWLYDLWCSMFFIQLVFCCQTAPNTMWILSQNASAMKVPNIPRSHLQESEMISGDRKSWTDSKEWVGLRASPKHHVVESLFGAMNLLFVRNDDLEIVHCNTQHVKEEVPALEYVSIVGGGTLWSDRESVHEESYLHGSKICWWLRTMMWLGAG